MPLIPGLAPHQSSPGSMTFCSWRVGWRSLLLRAFNEPQEVEEFNKAPTGDQLIVLVTEGSCEIESFRNRQWSRATYRPGDLGMTAPGEAAHLRWKGSECHATLQLHLPKAIISAVADDFHDERVGVVMPTSLAIRDPAVAEIMLALHRAALSSAPDLYAETAAHFLAAHLLHAHCHAKADREARPPRETLSRVDAYMRAHLAEPHSLESLAKIAELSRFQLLRAASAVWRETPLRHLTRLRMEFGQNLLLRTRRSVAVIALECGYQNPAHFGTAFRRHVGVTPSDFRAGRTLCRNLAKIPAISRRF